MQSPLTATSEDPDELGGGGTRLVYNPRGSDLVESPLAFRGMMVLLSVPYDHHCDFLVSASADQPRVK